MGEVRSTYLLRGNAAQTTTYERRSRAIRGGMVVVSVYGTKGDMCCCCAGILFSIHCYGYCYLAYELGMICV